MESIDVPKGRVVEMMELRIQEEKEHLTVRLAKDREELLMEFDHYAAQTMEGKTPLGRHLKELEERLRMYREAATTIPLTPLDFKVVMDGEGGGKEVLYQMEVEEKLQELSKLFGRKLRVSPEELSYLAKILKARGNNESVGCGKPNCPVCSSGGFFDKLSSSLDSSIPIGMMVAFQRTGPVDKDDTDAKEDGAETAQEVGAST